MSRMPVEVKNRIKDAKGRGKLKNFSYLTQSRMGIEELKCKTCDASLKTLQIHLGLSDILVIKGQRTQQQAVMLTETNNYAEIEITFDNESKHHTPICKACTGSLTTDMLEDIYAADMEQWEEDEKLGLGSVDWKLADRSPVSYKRIK